MAKGLFGRVLSGTAGVMGLLLAPTILSAQTTAAPTFTRDVAPIFQKKCESCHRPDSIAPMSLITYQEARPWARGRQRFIVGPSSTWALEITRSPRSRPSVVSALAMALSSTL